MARTKKAAAAAIEPTEGAAAPSETPVIDAAAEAIVADAEAGTATEAERAAPAADEAQVADPEDLAAIPGESQPSAEEPAEPVSTESATAVAGDDALSAAIEAVKAAGFVLLMPSAFADLQQRAFGGPSGQEATFGHWPLMALKLDGRDYHEGRMAWVNRDTFNDLRDAGVFEGEWEDGFEGLDDDD